MNDGVQPRVTVHLRQRFIARLLHTVMVIFVSSATLLPAPEVRASANYYDDSTGTDILSSVFQNTSVTSSCSSCHTGATTSCTGGADQTGFLNYAGVVSCYSRIQQKLSATPGWVTSRMPTTTVYTNNGTYASALSNWNSLGRPLAPPTVTGFSSGNPTKIAATLSATFDTNTSYLQGAYSIIYSPDNVFDDGDDISIASGAQNSTTGTFRSGGTGNSLTCSTTYYYRARASNGAANADVTGSFPTDPCTDPVISISAGTNPVLMSEDSNPQPFILTLQVANDDPGTHTWSISSPAGNGTAGASGTGATKAITYTPNANYTGTDAFTVRATNNTNGLFDDYVVNVTISVVDDPPTIDEGAGPVAVVMDEDSSPTAFGLTLNATDIDTGAGGMIWSISSSASDGAASVAGDNGYSEVISYIPDPDFFGSDSFTVQVTDAGTPDTIIVDVTVNPRNDAPVISALGTQAGTEGSLLTITPVVTDPDDANDGIEIAWGFVSGQQAGMNISLTGVITWTPPLGPPAVFGQSYPIVIQAQDGLEHGSVADTDSFTITIDPPDFDLDLVADYDDLCLTVSDATNADNDGDGVAGTDGGVNSGGDICDLDDDNDGMPDSFEIANGFDPFLFADAALDADGDGISNLQEFLDGTNPNFINLVIDSTGYLTPYTLQPPPPTMIDAAATAVLASDYGPYRPGRNTITWTASNAGNSNLATSDQTLDVRPIVSFGANQLAAEGNTIAVTATLNGDAPSYPVTVNYSVSGTATAVADHNAIAGALVFTIPNQSASLMFNVANDGLPEANETVVFAIDSVTNGVLGSSATHTVTIVDGNLAPVVELRFSQAGMTVGSAYLGGMVTVDAVVVDANGGQTHTLDWSGTANSLVPPTDLVTTSWMLPPALGNYLIDVIVTDNGAPAGSTRITRVLNIEAVAPALTTANSDGEGADDVTEGSDDSDNDGVPDYLDANSAGVSDSNLIPNQTVDLSRVFIIQTEPGLKISIGSTARAGHDFGVMVTDSRVENFGGSSGGPPLFADDSFDHIGGVYDFEVSGMVTGTSVRTVIPLQTSIPKAALYRKFNVATGWNNFVVDGSNAVFSARGEPGACPEPGSSEYRSGLTFLDYCIQLLIQDGGPNDTDQLANGVIRDPGAVAVQLTDPVAPGVQGGGRISPYLLMWLLVLGSYRLWNRSKVIINEHIL